MHSLQVPGEGDLGATAGISWGRVVSLLGTLALAVACGLLVHPRAFVAAAVIGTLLVSGIVVPWIIALVVRGRVTVDRSRGEVGQPLTITCELRALCPWPVYGLVIDPGWRPSAAGAVTSHPPPCYAIDRVLPLVRQVVRGELIPTQRGEFPNAPATVATAFPLQIGRGRRELSTQGRVLVWPRMIALPAPPEFGSQRGYESVARTRQSGTAGDVQGHRPYRAGESLRRVHWKLSARHEQLIVCERSSVARDRVLLVLDASVADSRSLDAAEHAITVVASLTAALVDYRRPCHVELDCSHLYKIESRRHLPAVLDALARIQLTTTPNLGAILASGTISRKQLHEAWIVLSRDAFSRLDLATQTSSHRYLVVGGKSDHDDQLLPGANLGVVRHLRMDDAEHTELRAAWKEVAA